MSNRVNIVIGGQADPSLTSTVRTVEDRLGGLESVLDRIGARAKWAALAAGTAVAALVRHGVTFQSQMESSEIALAAMMRQLAPEQFRTMEASLEGAARLVRRLRQEALTTTATFQDLIQGTQALFGPAVAAGISVEQVPALVAMISRAISTVMPQAGAIQMAQEGRALLTGQISAAAQLARSLGITGQEIRQARESGRLLDFLTDKMAAFNDAAELSSRTLSGLTSRLKDSLGEATGQNVGRSMEAIKGMIESAIRLVDSPGFGKLMRVLDANVAALADLAASGLDMVAGQGQERRWYHWLLPNLDDMTTAIWGISNVLGLIDDDTHALYWRNLTGQLQEELAAAGGKLVEVLSGAAAGTPARWEGKLPWSTDGQRSDGGWMTRGWLTRGSVQLWQQQVNYARSMARDLGLIAGSVQRYLPRLAEQEL